MPQLSFPGPKPGPVNQTLDGLIADLQALRAEHGNMDVLYHEYSWGDWDNCRLHVGEIIAEVVPGNEQQIKRDISDADPDKKYLVINSNGVV